MEAAGLKWENWRSLIGGVHQVSVVLGRIVRLGEDGAREVEAVGLLACARENPFFHRVRSKSHRESSSARRPERRPDRQRTPDVPQAAGYCVFRGANSQKDAFRRDPKAPEVAHLQYMNTKRGTRLLTSGWWGLARKINYTGDWLMRTGLGVASTPRIVGMV